MIDTEGTRHELLVVLRHGETTWSRAGRDTGGTGASLTANGEAQAQALG